MTIKRHMLAVAMLALCIAGIYPIARGIAAPKDDAGGKEPAIVFDDPAHATFFKYQAFLAKQGEEAETKESWKLLEGPERAQKVAEGEAFLKELRAKLMAKKELSQEELRLIEAVWGLPQKPDVAAHFNPKGREKEEARTEKSVAVITEGVGEIRASDGWNLMFDGNNQTGKDATYAGAGRMGETGAAAEFVERKPEVAKTLDKIQVPSTLQPREQDQQPQRRGKTLPFALGGIVLAGAYFGIKAARRKRHPVGGIVDFPNTKGLEVDEMGRTVLPEGRYPKGVHLAAKGDDDPVEPDPFPDLLCEPLPHPPAPDPGEPGLACPPSVSTCPPSVSTCPAPSPDPDE